MTTQETARFQPASEAAGHMRGVRPAEDRVPRSVEPVMQVAGSALPFHPQVKTFKAKRPPKPLRRGGYLQRTTPLRAGPSKHQYGGASAEFPTYGGFRDAIRLRDRGECRACLILRGHRRDGTELAHLLWRVQGKRTTSTVNFRWNALWSCYEHARRTDISKLTCAQLVRALVILHKGEPGYVLPERAREEVRRLLDAEPVSPHSLFPSPSDTWDSFERGLTDVDGRS